MTTTLGRIECWLMLLKISGKGLRSAETKLVEPEINNSLKTSSLVMFKVEYQFLPKIMGPSYGSSNILAKMVGVK